MLFLAHKALCAAYIQGGLGKLTDFPGADAEMTYFRLAPPALFAVLVIALAEFALLPTLIALRFWDQPAGKARHAAANAFFEHLGLVGGFLLVAWPDLARPPSLELWRK
ncbi:DoxX family membrane protein [Roseomonas xinghualingensis]|uniref:DoxX family membrane protein n=1 Tax=Roseomonas xinghualingensis TaxID=2986475 RepID=UPI0021F15EC7|nr:DoxX family membrane protein [Roseomonas sp. SXEYE001]